MILDENVQNRMTAQIKSRLKETGDLSPISSCRKSLMPAIERFFSRVTFAVLASAVLLLWLNPGRAWLHPELLPIGGRLASETGGFWTQLSILFDWRLFDSNPQRVRLVSEFFEVIDAMARPAIATVYAHPVLS